MPVKINAKILAFLAIFFTMLAKQFVKIISQKMYDIQEFLKINSLEMRWNSQKLVLTKTNSREK